MSYKMAQNLNVKQGDFVSWHIVGDDKWQKTRIAQIYRDPSVQGIAMKRDVFESLEYDFITVSYTNLTLPTICSV